MPFEPAPLWGWGVLAAGLALAVAAIAGFARWPLALVAALLLGFAAAKLNEIRLATPVLGAPVVTHLTARVVILMSLGGLWLVIWRKHWRWWGLLLVVIGIGIAWTAHPPDMLVAPDARTVAIRGSDGLLHFVRKAADKYAARDWLKRDGDGRDIEDAVGVPGMRCDGVGCVMKGKSLIAVSIKPEALAEDCVQAQIVVSAAQAPDCKGPAIVIDQKAAAEGQGWRITLSPTPAAQSVRAYRGTRPWVVSSGE